MRGLQGGYAYSPTQHLRSETGDCRVKKLSELSIEEKVQRLAHQVYMTSIQIPVRETPGYETVVVNSTLEGWNDFLGVFPELDEPKK